MLRKAFFFDDPVKSIHLKKTKCQIDYKAINYDQNIFTINIR